MMNAVVRPKKNSIPKRLKGFFPRYQVKKLANLRTEGAVQSNRKSSEYATRLTDDHEEVP